MARNSGDIQDSWQSVAEAIEVYGENEGNFSAVAGPGYFNDPDEVSTSAGCVHYKHC